MKTFLKIASIPLAIFLILIGIPRMVATLINMHSDMGIATLVFFACALLGSVGLVATHIIKIIKSLNAPK